MSRTLILSAALALTATAALADPCTAPLPRQGQTFAGPVRHVGDGDSLCVGRTADPRTWIEVRVADFYAAELNAPGGREARAALARITQGRTLRCIAGRRSWDRVVATCRLPDGRTLGQAMRAAGVPEGGNR